MLRLLGLLNQKIEPTSIVSYNHLGNNDGMNLSAPQTFRSKEISKSNVVDDMVSSNGILYEPGEHPDHVIVIKYVPYVGDSKRAMDEYTSRYSWVGKFHSFHPVATILSYLTKAPLVWRTSFLPVTSFEHSNPNLCMEVAWSIQSCQLFDMKARAIEELAPNGRNCTHMLHILWQIVEELAEIEELH
ncbi:hypothetical protein IFM89_012084 [Coptis chinensis]|uniref:inositol-3-phosphate synthase n=1 Tax=Coptis chinensis TaxID=261450 RepID=A0A835I1S3_9MAGN|nr:hypothetical protein IFM89_012084 [Coptis chinensis]